VEGHAVRWKVTQSGGRSHSPVEGHTVRWQVTQSGGRSHSPVAGHTVRWKVTQSGGRSHSPVAGHTVFRDWADDMFACYTSLVICVIFISTENSSSESHVVCVCLYLCSLGTL